MFLHSVNNKTESTAGVNFVRVKCLGEKWGTKSCLFPRQSLNMLFYDLHFFTLISFVFIALQISYQLINPLKTKLRPLYLKTQFVPRSKHFISVIKTAGFNPLNKKRRLLYLKTQFVPRSKHFSSRL